jgi:hypothetical protein
MAAKAEPFAEKQLPAVDGLGGDGMNCGGSDFPGNGSDASEDRHQNGQHIDGIKTDLQDGTESLIAKHRGNFGEVRILNLKVHAGAEQRQKSGGGEKRGPKDFAASCFGKVTPAMIQSCLTGPGPPP